jgi:hypothetical protein
MPDQAGKRRRPQSKATEEAFTSPEQLSIIKGEIEREVFKGDRGL